jgi:hypothetical protein
LAAQRTKALKVTTMILKATSVILSVVLALTVTPASAMTGLEFLEASDNSASNEAAVMEPLVRQFVREGYHDVPDWTNLSVLTRDLILKKGYRDQNVADIAREAAIANGMSK